jgi:hypothetical protein
MVLASTGHIKAASPTENGDYYNFLKKVKIASSDSPFYDYL